MTETLPLTGRRKVWIAAGLVTLALASAMLLVWNLGRRRWGAFLAKQDAALERARALPGQAPRISGGTESDDPWAHYAAAAAAILHTRGEEEALIAVLYPKPGQSATEAQNVLAREILKKAAPALDRVREGARQAGAPYPRNWEAGATKPLNTGGLQMEKGLKRASRLLALSIRDSCAAGEFDRAIAEIGTGWQLGLDLCWAPDLEVYLSGTAVTSLVAEEAWAVAADPRLPAAGAAALSALAARADLALPKFSDLLEKERVLQGETFRLFAEGKVSHEDLGIASTPASERARFRYSTKEAIADWMERQARIVEEARRGETLEASIAMEALDRIWQESERENYVSREWSSAYSVLEHGNRAGHARFRLIAALCAERATGTPPAAIDPFDFKPLRRKESAGTVTWWSVNNDGDDGGVGGFYGEKGTDLLDYVLEWKR